MRVAHATIRLALDKLRGVGMSSTNRVSDCVLGLTPHSAMHPFTTATNINVDDPIAITPDTADAWCVPCDLNQSLVGHAGNPDVSRLARPVHGSLAAIFSMTRREDGLDARFLPYMAENLQKLGRQAFGYDTFCLALIVVRYLVRKLGAGYFPTVHRRHRQEEAA